MAPPPYGIIYNWDGAPHGYSAYPQSIDQFLDKVYAPLEDTQVGALCWCIALHEATWPSEYLDVTGDSTDRRYASARTLHHVENIRGFFERGEDPYGALVARGLEQGIAVYASVRMNDNHFWDLRPTDLATTTRNELTPLRKQHPEWLLGDDAPGWCSTSWNLAIPEVRSHILRLVTEACRQADWDGVELDWQRHAFHLPADHAYRLRYTLTSLMRAIRTETEAIAAERGRPFHVAVRVATTFESCRNIGYDIETWVGEKLCDLVIAGGNSGTDPGAEVERFTALCQRQGIPFYGGFDSDGRQQARRLRPHAQWRQEWFRGLARNYLDRGAQGIYVFNWHGHRDTHRPLLTTMGSLDTLTGHDKTYAALHRSIGPKTAGRAGAERDDRIYGETPVDLLPTLTGTGPTFHIHLSDEEPPSHAELQIEIAHFTAADKVRVALDGEDLGDPIVRDAAAEDPNDPADISENKWLTWSLSDKQAGRGIREVQVILLDRDPRLSIPLHIEHVEIYLQYSATTS